MQKTYENILREYNFTTNQNWLAPCYTPALPEMLLPIYVSSDTLTQQAIYFSPAIPLVVRSPQLMPTTRNY